MHSGEPVREYPLSAERAAERAAAMEVDVAGEESAAADAGDVKQTPDLAAVKEQPDSSPVTSPRRGGRRAVVIEDDD